MKSIHAKFDINIAVGSVQSVAALFICIFLCLMVFGEACRFRSYNLATSKILYFADTYLEDNIPPPASTSAINFKQDSTVTYTPRRIFLRAFEAPVYEPSLYIPHFMAHTYICEPYIIKILQKYSILSISTAGRAP